MNKLNIIVITFLATAIITIGFQISAFKILPNEITEDESIVPWVATPEQEFIEAKKEIELTPTEVRFRAIEARLSALENKQ